MGKNRKYTKQVEDKLEEKLYWFDPEAKKAWESLEANVKETISHHLATSIEKMENRVAIEMMACVIEDLIKRVKKLESDKT